MASRFKRKFSRGRTTSRRKTRFGSRRRVTRKAPFRRRRRAPLRRTVRGVGGLVKRASRPRRTKRSTGVIQRVIRTMLPTNRQVFKLDLTSTPTIEPNKWNPSVVDSFLITDLAIVARVVTLAALPDTQTNRTNNRIKLNYVRMNSLWVNESGLAPRYVRVMLFTRNNWSNFIATPQDQLFMDPINGSPTAWDQRSRCLRSYVNKFLWKTLYDKIFRLDLHSAFNQAVGLTYASPGGTFVGERRITVNIPINKVIRYNIEDGDDPGVNPSINLYFAVGVCENIGQGTAHDPNPVFCDGQVFLHFENLPDFLPMNAIF